MGADVAGRDGDKEDVPGNGDAVEKEGEWGHRTKSRDDEEEKIVLLVVQCQKRNVVVIYMAQKSGMDYERV